MIKKLNNKKIIGETSKKSFIIKTINYCFKILISGIFIFLILNFCCNFYCNIPYYAKDYKNSTVTPYKYEPMENFTYGIEGYGYGRINNDGYVNVDDYDSNKEVNILMVGSSQFEAFQVDIRDSVTSRLNAKLKDKFVYNIGISGNLFPKSISNLAPAITKYKPTDYIILEMSDVKYSDKELREVIEKEDDNENNSESSASQGKKTNIIRSFYNNSSLLRLLMRQVEKLINRETPSSIVESKEKFNEKLTGEVLNKIKTIVENKVKVIIVYHPSVTLDSDGKLLLLNNEKEDVEKFSKLCQENEIYFLDMSNRFKEEYEKNYILPYGFSNTSVGTGHLNKYGHEMIADELYKFIEEVE